MLNCGASEEYRGKTVTVFLPSPIVIAWIVREEIYPRRQGGWIGRVVTRALTVVVQGHVVNSVRACCRFDVCPKLWGQLDISEGPIS